jgi:myo-inositol-1(or 4)-monophosphatase/deoxyribonuclease-2
VTIACAHRGDSSRLRENTLVAIQAAIDAGAEVVEIDVRLTEDNQVVVIHDSTLERLWGISASVKDRNWDFISKLGEGDDRIPLLIEVLQLFIGSNSILMIDMEEAEPAELAHSVIATGPLDPTQIYWCGNLDGMKRIRALSNEARIWLPWNELGMPTQELITEVTPEFINLHYSFVNRARIAEFHNMGLKVAVWTVDDEATMRWAIAIGVDSITTNQLSALQNLLAESSLPLDLLDGDSIDEIDLHRAMIVSRDLGKWAILVASSMDPGTMNTKINPADIVTQVDLMIEIHVREVIAANFPNHNFVGEEMGGQFISDKPSWYLDPVDGTTNFANRMPWSSFSLALAFNRTPLVAVVIDPWRNSLFEAMAGRGAKLNGQEIKVEDQGDVANPLSSRIVSTELAAHRPWPGMLELLDLLSENYCTMRIMGSGTLTLVGVAAQRGVGSVIGQYSPIDHLAAALIVHEAGGAVWDETGSVNLFPETGGILVATQASAAPLFKIWQDSTKKHGKALI